VRPEEYEDVIAGIFFGWINKNAALMLEAKKGDGKMLITTFRIADAYEKDPYARSLFERMIEFVTSQSFQPNLSLES